MSHRWICAALFAALLTQDVAATELLKSWPESGAVLEQPLKSFRLWFDDLEDPGSAVVTITGGPEPLQIRGQHAMGDDNLMAMVDGAMPDGDYTLAWRADDGRGEIKFSVDRVEGYVEDSWELPLDIGIVLYDGAEPLDVFGPLEMWMNAGPGNIRVHLIAERAGPVVLTTTSYPKALAPTIQAPYSFDDHPDLDVIMVPGGIGTLIEADNPAMIEFLARTSKEAAVTTSVCTGSGLLAKAGVLKGVKATGNKAFFDYLVSLGDADWQSEARWVESGRVLTSSGVSAGIDMSLAVIARFFGTDIARMIADATEYVWNEDPDLDPFLSNLNTATPWVEGMRESFERQLGEEGD